MENLMVLITDDDIDDREFISYAFSNKGMDGNLKEFGDGAELLKFLSAGPISSGYVILLDLNMPIKDGYQTLKELKDHPVLCDIPVFILTTSSSEADRNYCANLGCEKYLIKPVTLLGYEQIANQIIDFMQQKLSGVRGA